MWLSVPTSVSGPDSFGQVFKVDLMADAGARRHHAKIVKRRLAPFQESVAFDIAFVFTLDIDREGARGAECVDHHRVIDDQIDRGLRVDFFGIAAKRHQPVAHRCQIDHRRHAGEILHQHAGRAIGDLAWVFAALSSPLGERPDVIHGDGFAVLKAQHIFKHHLEHGGQAPEIAQTGALRGGDRVICDRLRANAQHLAC